MRIELPLTEPQEQFVFSDYQFPAIVGGLGSGKSKAGTTRAIIKLLQNPSTNVGYYMPTYDLINLRALPGFEEDLSAIGVNYTINQSKYIIRVSGFGEIYLRSYDRPERIIAYETAHSIADELDTLQKDKAAFVWRKIVERNRQKCKGPNTVGNVTTPDQGYNGFTYEKWVKKQQNGFGLIKAPTYTNPFLPEGYIEQIRSNYDPILANLYIEGEFVSLTDKKVYHFFDRQKHHTDREIQDDDRLYIGLDFNVGGTCATVWVIDNNRPIAVDEFVSHDTHDFVNNLTRYKGHKLTVYPDSSGGNNSTNASATDIEIIENAGYAVDAPERNPFIRDRVNAMNALLSHDRMLVNTDKCPELTHALENQGYTDKGEPEKFKEHPAMDDWVDCAGYFVHQMLPLQRPSAAPRMG